MNDGFIVAIVLALAVAVICGIDAIEKNICIKNGGTPVVSRVNGVSCIYENKEEK